MENVLTSLSTNNVNILFGRKLITLNKRTMMHQTFPTSLDKEARGE